jgi:high-affinity Fe2+/Pb2+ permease
MKIQNTNFLKKFKEEKSSNYIFLSIIILFLIIIIILFLYSTNFIAKNINKRFSITEIENIKTLDESSYKLIEKKLNLKAPSAEDALITDNKNTNTTNKDIPILPKLN